MATLVVEVVLGIDNLIVMSALTNKLPAHQEVTAWLIGISLDPVLRLGLLGTIAIIIQITKPLFTALEHGFSWQVLILIAGGLFLIWKATKEINHYCDPRRNLSEG